MVVTAAAAAVDAGPSSSSSSSSSSRRQLARECTTLRRLVYCNTRQHRRHKTLGRLRALLGKVELLLAALSAAAEAPAGRGGAGERARLLQIARFVAVEVDFAATRCAADLAGMLSRALYVPLALAASASVARIFGAGPPPPRRPRGRLTDGDVRPTITPRQVALERKLLLETVHRYNSLGSARESTTDAPAGAGREAPSRPRLPLSLRCVARGGSRIRLKENMRGAGRPRRGGGADTGAAPAGDSCDLGEEVPEGEAHGCAVGGGGDADGPPPDGDEDDPLTFWEERTAPGGAW